MSYGVCQKFNHLHLSMTIKMKKITSDNDWETKTTLSGKYKEVNAEDILGKLDVPERGKKGMM